MWPEALLYNYVNNLWQKENWTYLKKTMNSEWKKTTDVKCLQLFLNTVSSSPHWIYQAYAPM